MNSRLLSLSAVMFFQTISFLGFSQENMNAKDIIAEVMLQNIGQFANFSPVSFKAKSEFSFSKEFTDVNPQSLKLNGCLTYFKGVMTENKYRISAVCGSNESGWSGEYVATWDGETSNYLNPDGDSRLFISKKFSTDPDGGMHLASVLFTPYAFLVPTKEDIKVPFITAEKVCNSTTWEMLAKNAALIETSPEGNPTVKFVLPNKTSYVVTFSKNDRFYPISLKKYSSNGILAMQYQVESFALLKDGKKTFSFPDKTILSAFSRTGVKLYTVIAQLSEVNLDRGISDDNFHLDMASVDAIYDVDNKVQIAVPR